MLETREAPGLMVREGEVVVEPQELISSELACCSVTTYSSKSGEYAPREVAVYC